MHLYQRKEKLIHFLEAKSKHNWFLFCSKADWNSYTNAEKYF